MDSALVLKLALGVGSAVAGAVVFAMLPWGRLTDLSFRRCAIGLLLFSRLLTFLTLYVALHLSVPSDVVNFYVPQGRCVLAGQAPYRDFPTSYGPAFPYLIAGILWFWNSGRAIVLVAIAFETASFWAWTRFAARVHSSIAAREAAILYVFGPVPIVISAVSGQNQLWMGLALALACGAIARRDAISGAWMGLSAVAVKILAVLFVPPLLLFSRRPWLWVAAFGGIVAAGYGGVQLLGGDPLVPIHQEAERISSGNLPFLLTALAIPHTRLAESLTFAVFAVAYLSVFLLGWKRQVGRDLSRLVPAICVMLLIFMILSQKSFTNYLAIFYFPLCLCFALGARMSWSRMLLFGLGGAVASFEPSAWFRWLGASDLSTLFSHDRPFGKSALIGFVGVEAALMAFYLILLNVAWRLLFPPSDAGLRRAPSSDENPVLAPLGATLDPTVLNSGSR